MQFPINIGNKIRRDFKVTRTLKINRDISTKEVWARLSKLLAIQITLLIQKYLILQPHVTCFLRTCNRYTHSQFLRSLLVHEACRHYTESAIVTVFSKATILLIISGFISNSTLERGISVLYFYLSLIFVQTLILL